MLNKYYTYIEKLNQLYYDSRNKFCNPKIKNLNYIKPFELNFKININEKFLNSKVIKITNKIYEDILDCIIELKFKINWLSNEYKNELEKVKEKLIELENIQTELIDYRDELLENILDSKILKNSSSSLINYTYDYLENFNLKDDYIIPSFFNINKLDFQSEIHSNKKIVYNIQKTKFVSRIDLYFNTNINEEIIIMYKKGYSSKIEFTTEKIKLSKRKSISLKFEDCAQIIIFSNSNFVDYLINTEIFGSSEEIKETSIKGIIDIPIETKKLLIDTNEDFYFYEFEVDKELHELKQLDNNLINNINTNKILMICNTNKSNLNKFKIYKKE